MTTGRINQVAALGHEQEQKRKRAREGETNLTPHTPQTTPLSPQATDAETPIGVGS